VWSLWLRGSLAIDHLDNLAAIRSALNSVRGNQPKEPTPLAGGIVVVSTASFGAGPGEHNLIKRNHAFNNRPADIVWDRQGSGNRFRHNRCDTSAAQWPLQLGAGRLTQPAVWPGREPGP
jgi:hypothetical protein